MKKIILAVIAVTMLLSNTAFASTKTIKTNNEKSTVVLSDNKNNVFHLKTQDPHGW